MYQAFEATVDQLGHIQLKEPVRLPTCSRVLVVVLDEVANLETDETALLSEQSLAEVWNRPEEDAAWAYLQSEK